MAALLVTGAPVLVGLAMAVAPAEDVGQMQSAVVVSRFPLMALLLLQSLLVPVFARRSSLFSLGDYRAIVGFLVLCLPVASLVAYSLGRGSSQVLYGSAYVIEPDQMALLTLGATALGGIQVLIALAVSADLHRLALQAYPPAIVVTTCVAFLGGLPLGLRVPVAMAAGPLVGFSVAVWTTTHWRRQTP